MRISQDHFSYNASKGATIHVNKMLATEIAKNGIKVRVNSIAPGYVMTELNSEFLAGEGGEKMKARIPARRFGRVEDLDGALLLLASDAGAYINGAQIAVDGGHLCSSL